MVGGSHARRLANAMGENGVSLERITSGGWKITSANVAALLQKMEELTVKPDVVIMQIFDNSSFFCLGEDGTLSLPQVGPDGHYHVIGELRVATKDQSKAMLKTITPLLTALPDCRKIIISCLPRYIGLPCCGAAGHLSNFDRVAKDKIMTDLNALKRGIRSHLFTEKIANTVIVDPVTICGAMDADSYLDPVHLQPEGYKKLADHLIRLGIGADSTGEEDLGPSNKRAKTVQDTVGQHNAAAGRRGSMRGGAGSTPGGRGRGRGGRGGGRRGRGSGGFFY